MEILLHWTTRVTTAPLIGNPRGRMSTSTNPFTSTHTTTLVGQTRILWGKMELPSRYRWLQQPTPQVATLSSQHKLGKPTTMAREHMFISLFHLFSPTRQDRMSQNGQHSQSTHGAESNSSGMSGNPSLLTQISLVSQQIQPCLASQSGSSTHPAQAAKSAVTSKSISGLPGHLVHPGNMLQTGHSGTVIGRQEVK